MDQPFWGPHRQRQLADVCGEVLEIGVGTGLNLPHYPDTVRKIVTVDPNPGMNVQLQRRIAQTGIEVDRRVVGGESLPFESNQFASVVSTITLCSISSVHAALGELVRVLRPGGRFFFLEHGLCPDPSVARWQGRLNWLQRRLAAGCILTLDVPSLVSEQPFSTLTLETFYMEETPTTHGFMYRGVATK